MEYQIEKIEYYLRLIERTRLLCNSSFELAKLVGCSIESGNGLHRKGGKSLFLKDAIFRELVYITKEKTDLDLEEVLIVYKESCETLKKMGNLKNKKKICHDIILHFFNDQELPKYIQYLEDDISEKHVPILLLLILGIIPHLDERKGDVRDINGDYKNVLSFLKDIVSVDIPMQVLPAIGRMENEIIKHPEKKSRIHLISLTNFILCSYGALSNKERIAQSIKELEPIQLSIEGIWETRRDLTEFWVFEEISNGYNLFKYSYKSSENRLHYIKYFMNFYNENDGIWAIIIHPKSIHYIISNKPIPNCYFSYYHVDIKNNELAFIPFSENDKSIDISILMKSKKRNYWEKMLNAESTEKIDIYKSDSYIFEISLAAITENFIYIRKNEDSFYKIPKNINSVLYNVDFRDTVGIISFNDRIKHPNIYIAFDNYNLYIDISTPQKTHKSKIEIVDSINEI